jgi:hypothetical protein
MNNGGDEVEVVDRAGGTGSGDVGMRESSDADTGSGCAQSRGQERSLIILLFLFVVRVKRLSARWDQEATLR